ncbi:MAG: hypothetical protein J0H99_22210 [Rhodospirillales bacterium]|nr:hypothetical protein [Rhodospirillales bacterium]
MAASRLDVGVALAALVAYLVLIWIFQYRHVLGEPDLYRVIVGLMDGAESGRYLNSPLHYDRDFGFGYLAAMYRFVPAAMLHDPDRLTPLMNQVGFWALAPGLVCFWAAVRLVHGTLAATVALIVFAFSPMMVELGTSGHPVLPMFAFLSAAAVCLFLPLQGGGAVLFGVAGALLLPAVARALAHRQPVDADVLRLRHPAVVAAARSAGDVLRAATIRC